MNCNQVTISREEEGGPWNVPFPARERSEFTLLHGYNRSHLRYIAFSKDFPFPAICAVGEFITSHPFVIVMTSLAGHRSY